MNFYEHLCSNPQFISLPKEVGEFLLHFVKLWDFASDHEALRLDPLMDNRTYKIFPD